MRYLDGAVGLKALVIGEPIIDEYVFCYGLGKASKDPVLAVQYHSLETHAGGALAIANHLAGIVSHVSLISQIGEVDSCEEFMRRHLMPNVTPYFTQRQNAPTIHKRRFVDHYTGTRMFEVYTMDDTETRPADIKLLVDQVSDIAGDYDLVIVADYGHGMMARPVIDAVLRSARFVCVNVCRYPS